MDRDSKLVLGYRVGNRTGADATTFMTDVAGRVVGRPAVATDSLKACGWAVFSAFKGDVDHTMVHKVYESSEVAPGRHCPPRYTGCEKTAAHGAPNVDRASTLHIERQNLSVRMGSRRFTRLTNGFSKRIENHAHAVALHYWYFNFARRHMTLKTTPVVAAGIASREYTMLERVRMIETAEADKGGRLTDYLPAADVAR